MVPVKASRSAWTYGRFDAHDVVETGLVQGREVGLPAQFHDEDQLTFVNAGRRRYLLGGKIIALGAGDGLLIPAGAVHASLAEPAEIACLNVYMPPGTYAPDEMLGEAARRWRIAGRLDATTFVSIIRRHRRDGLDRGPTPVARRDRVGAMAERHGMSREGFSRAFAREHGMPPHAFALAARLNAARRRLRIGEDIAAVAVATGFVDQSHLGRFFRRAFGVTPGQYRAGLSQSYQTPC